MTLNEMLESGDLDPDKYEGFTIKNGKKVYWYITPMPNSALYRCLPIEGDKLGWPRWIPGSTEINLTPKKEVFT